MCMVVFIYVVVSITYIVSKKLKVSATITLFLFIFPPLNATLAPLFALCVSPFKYSTTQF